MCQEKIQYDNVREKIDERMRRQNKNSYNDARKAKIDKVRIMQIRTYAYYQG